MAVLKDELAEICGRLPESKQEEVLDFARFLAQQQGDAEWERILEDGRPRPKLNRFVEDALAEGPAEPLDPAKL